MIKSKAFIYADFDSAWYKKWGKLLKQTPSGRGDFALRANKFWQNAIMVQALYERGALEAGKQGIGFGVGKERLPALFASLDVKVLATDQDFKASKAAAWDNNQLSHGRQSLNIEKICPPAKFEANVVYQAADMSKLSKKLNGRFDFLWSNCALGHLGSIEKGLGFIEKSLDCLKSDGWAVHTTEVNILSDSQTLDNAGTVFFRQRDLLKLFTKLSRQGYIVKPLNFDLGSTQRDKGFTLTPEWGSEFSKLLFDGFMATQVLLIIHKPLRPLSKARIQCEVAKHRGAYVTNKFRMGRFLAVNPALRQLLSDDRSAKHLPATKTQVLVLKNTYRLQLKAGQAKDVRLAYTNQSRSGLFKLHATFKDTAPLVLATYRPVNHRSKLADKTWYADNRPTIKFLDSRRRPIEYVRPGQEFIIKFQLSSRKLKPGKYSEWVGLVKEGDGIIPESETELQITVT